MSRELGAEIIGIYQISQSILGVFMTLVSSGIPLTISRFSAQFKAKKQFKEQFV
jgi:O-antigen/teichoic acid export membrane protein